MRKTLLNLLLTAILLALIALILLPNKTQPPESLPTNGLIDAGEPPAAATPPPPSPALSQKDETGEVDGVPGGTEVSVDPGPPAETTPQPVENPAEK